MMRYGLNLFSLPATVFIGVIAIVPAHAQFRGGGYSAFGLGFYTGSTGLNSPYYGSGLGFTPFYYNGFWGNGMSMYGPPVPTFAPIPGTFGGSDYRVNQNAPFWGGGALMYHFQTCRVPANAPVPAFTSNPNEPHLLNEQLLNAPEISTLMVEVRVPLENATVFFNNQVTRTNGAVRVFASPPLKPGEIYKYDVKAEWIIDGRKTSLTRTVQGKAGEQVVADFVAIQ